MKKQNKHKEEKENTNTSNHSSNESSGSSGIIRWIEKLGNKLPHPFWIFVWICIAIIVLSGITSVLGVSATDTSTGEVI